MHNSVPFAMDGSDKALLDLKPNRPGAQDLKPSCRRHRLTWPSSLDVPGSRG